MSTVQNKVQRYAVVADLPQGMEGSIAQGGNNRAIPMAGVGLVPLDVNDAPIPGGLHITLTRTEFEAQFEPVP